MYIMQHVAVPFPASLVSNSGVADVVICGIGNGYEWCLGQLPSQTRARSTQQQIKVKGCSPCGQTTWKLQHGVQGLMCLTESEKSGREMKAV